MSDEPNRRAEDEDDEEGVSWKEVFAELRAGKTVELPVVNDQEYKRRQRHLDRRAEKYGIRVEITREVGRLRATMAGQAEPTAPAERSRERDRPSKEERRAQKRAARAAGDG